MSHLSRSTLLLAMALAMPLSAQQSTATFRVDVLPTVELQSGDAVRITYRVRFHSSAADTLSEFAVKSPVAVQRITPGTRGSTSIFGMTREGDSDAASWGWTSSEPVDGQTSAPVSYEAIGLPGIVSFRAARWVPSREAGPGELDQDPGILSYDEADADQVIGKTVGVVPFPSDMSSEAMGRRAEALAADACALGWIDNAGVCNSLRVKIRARHWDALLHELDAQRGKHVDDNAYFLLYPTAQRLSS